MKYLSAQLITLTFLGLTLAACSSAPSLPDTETPRQAQAERARNAADRAQEQLKDAIKSKL